MTDQKTKKVHGAESRPEGRFEEGHGGRKTAMARVRVYSGQRGGIMINDKDLKRYFPNLEDQHCVTAPLELLGLGGEATVSVHVRGGGMKAQAEAVRHGLARALGLLNPDFRKKLRKSGYMTRDARTVERKKYGLKKARRAPQWAKR